MRSFSAHNELGLKDRIAVTEPLTAQLAACMNRRYNFNWVKATDKEDKRDKIDYRDFETFEGTVNAQFKTRLTGTDFGMAVREPFGTMNSPMKDKFVPEDLDYNPNNGRDVNGKFDVFVGLSNNKIKMVWKHKPLKIWAEVRNEWRYDGQEITSDRPFKSKKYKGVQLVHKIDYVGYGTQDRPKPFPKLLCYIPYIHFSVKDGEMEEYNFVPTR